MSVTESKAKSPARASKKTVKPANAAALKIALEAAQIEMVPLSALVKSPLNVRTIPYPVESVRELADTIAAIGLLQNLVVHALPDGLLGVAAGGRRLTALQLLCAEQRIDADYRVAVKRVSDELAAVASVAENSQRVAMHPAEQITGFRTLSAQGKTPEQIGGQLGYSTLHVKRMLKLANLAPELIALLAENTIDVEQCQSLSLESDPARQMAIYQQVKAEYSRAPAHLLKRAIIDTEISIGDPRFVFIGREAYEAAGGVVREDLFSAEEGSGTADRVLLDRLVQEKLAATAQAIQQDEGWAWSLAREMPLKNYGEDRERYLLLPVPEGQYSADEQQQLDELYAAQEAAETYEDEVAIQVLIEDIESAAAIRAWTPEQKAACGVVVSLTDGQLCVQRGVQLKEADKGEADAGCEPVSIPRTSDVADGVSLPLLTKMSSERTLAVQAALMQQPERAVAVLAWTLCRRVFAFTVGTGAVQVSLSCHHSCLTEDAPSGKDGAAFVALMQEKERLASRLPPLWERDVTSFFSLSGEDLLALLSFCTACSVDGVQTREYGHTTRSRLDPLESAIGFHLRDWWQPTKDNFFMHMPKPAIIALLNEAGLSGAARDAEKMKKSDAAEHAEQALSGTRWVPGWMHSPEQAEADTAVDVDIHPADAA
ncbi:ParB/RepB/Spo0J family partition protein (plasmid) [Edwardsiella tarda]|uniref:ParB/RepB/Spo0J family partition protein n=1 Tax=Edwardsiella tarda TaxID=636 RepID=UPI002444D73B|nr:ParB/RepB/Spo0J family partition protein [Edwardsiella tarda]WGE31043.1 ParB/RepB/Spo0J family partition protein [Edwardsiella tarda]